MKHRLKIAAVTACALLSLTACEGAKKELGLTKSAPDEFAVIKRAPLAMPPDYTLRPPRPGMARPQEMESGDEARTAVFGGTDSNAAYIPPQGVSDSESSLLMQAGSAQAEPDIRRRVDYETSQIAPREKTVAQKLLGVGGDDGEPPATTVVDAKAEAERLRQNAEEGKPVTEGETPGKEE